MENDYYQPPQPPKPFTTGKREFVYGGLIVLVSLAAVNFTLYGGFNLGFAAAALISLLVCTGYLLLSGCKPTPYSLSILALCAVIAAGFGRSDDGFVKAVLLIFLFLGINLGFGLLSGKNRFSPDHFLTLGDSFSVCFGLSFGQLEPALSGLVKAIRSGGKLGRGLGSVALGLCIVFPILLAVIPLLISADAAFDGLVSLLPEFRFQEMLVTLVGGAMLFCLLYTRAAALVHSSVPGSADRKATGKLSPITVNTVMGAVCFVYLFYLISQLAYVSGGFSGLLPPQFTLAEYARRGFFEMGALCAINLAVISLCLGIVKKQGSAPLSLRLMCLFLGLVTLFLVASASAKMFLYIGSYGLTRLRLLTQIIMLFLAISTVTVMVWLFLPKIPCMKVIILAALIIGAAVIWLDVDSMVAGFNVDAYLSGRLSHLDMEHLTSLGSGAAPHIDRLAKMTSDPAMLQIAKAYLSGYESQTMDLRSWNWSAATAQQLAP